MVAVVVLPGLDGTTALLQEFCESLAAVTVVARAVAYPPDQAFGYEQLEPLVRAQLPSEPFVLVGESFSGPLAIRIAADPPPNLLGLVLSTTFARAPLPGLSAFAPLARFAPARPPMLLLSWLLLGPWATPRLHSQLSSALGAVRSSVLRARAVATLRVDVSKLLPSVRLPVLQLIASSDRLLAGDAASVLASGLTHCRTVTVPGPHLLLQTATRECAREVAEFALGLCPNISLKRTDQSLRD
jgi:pimeloyl-ACP methyl ester carboxylesterase